MLCHTRCTYPEAKQVVAPMDIAQCIDRPRVRMPATCCNVHMRCTYVYMCGAAVNVTWLSPLQAWSGLESLSITHIPPGSPRFLASALFMLRMPQRARTPD